MLINTILVGALAAVAHAAQGTLQQMTGDFGPNPTNTFMFFYKPAQLANPPSLLVAMHFCTGTAEAYFTGTQYADLADQLGFIVIYPQSPDGSGGCWDVHTNATLTHNAGGDSLGIASMTRFAIDNWGVDANRVFATGTSSGAMMTSVLMGAYPDLFKGGAGFSGVAFGCFEGPDAWNEQCALGERIMTPQQWGDLVRSGFPGFAGQRPKVQVWHGTADTTLFPQNFFEEIKQWTNVFGYSATPISNITNDPQAGYSFATFGPNFEAILAQGVGHTVPEHAENVLEFFGLS
ncbi:carbohydrate esterase family 1 protein [Punctularia strigosozonata HHB-11173 SS5]|uniref:Carboxylic ester hydrolase n=1 Tax=Punctularia strigosozonata (strain HHB-11173) TaxID=741275 RepID=R7S2W6_PUNST|nr:carbohydrate esterase family 1 protein [Punctularia strigosozonata HHB-11173 SS5]EIN04563.1 carbohydrate esterase family 1 protein [Punctularia strigosozonata HHB-11173 SS5]